MITLFLPLAALLPYIVPIAAAGLTYLGQRYVQKRQEKQQEKAQDYNVANYQMQRQDAVQDWNTQNQYNSPKQQMQRLREAGLNPHLVYGKGAENTAAMIRASTTTAPQLPPEGRNIAEAAMGAGMAASSQMSALRINRAQTDNLNAQRALLQAQTMETLVKTDRAKFDYGQAERQKDVVFEKLMQDLLNAKGEGEKRAAEIENIHANTQRLKALMPLEVEKMTQEISNLGTTQQLTKTQIDKIVAETQSVLDGNMRANDLHQSTKDLLLMQVNEQRQKMGLDPIEMPELLAKLDALSTQTALNKFELEFQEEFKKLSQVAKAAYMAAMLLKMFTD